VRFIGEETSTADAWVRHGHGSDVHQHLDIQLGAQAVQAIAHLKDFLVQWQFIGDFDVDQWIAPAPLHGARSQQRLVA
jgi:ABC-type nitrate/sulfonate/bicarbonate transport system substrate-binding protein